MNLTKPITRILSSSRVHVQHYCTYGEGCTNRTGAVVSREEYDNWVAGAHPQTAFPRLTPTQIEALFITGWCGSCWNRVFADPKECGFCQQTDCEGECEPEDYYDPSMDYPEYDPQTAFFEREGRPMFPNEY